MTASKRWKLALTAIAAALSLQMSGLGGYASGTASADAAAEAGAIYYVDSAAGDDANAGTDTDHPWKTLQHVSAEGSMGAFRPGDQILLKSGGVWNERFEMKFSGSPEAQITVGAYGGEAKPVINGGGLDAAVKIENQQYVTLQDIEITNYNAAAPDDYKAVFHKRSGVWLMAYHNGPMSGIQLKGLDIHDVTGLSVSGEDWVDDPDSDNPDTKINKNFNAAIMVNAWEWENVAPDKHGYYKDLLIENNNIHDIRTIGINMDGYQNDLAMYHQNVIIRGNTINKTGSDGIVVGVAHNPIIENNAVYDVGINSYDFKWIAGIWVWKSNGATFRHNEVARVHYLNAASADSSAFDTDIQAQGDHVFEYNYSHDNAGGFVMDMGQLTNGTNYYRYNVSRNDMHNRSSGRTVEVSDPGVFYNNVFYNDIGNGGVILSNNPKTTYVNNIFYASQGNAPYPAAPAFYNNDFFGATPPSQGLRNLTDDPMFVDPSGGDGMDKTAGFKLSASSPLIGKGRIVADNGGKDMFGNPLYAGSPDIGLFEDPASAIADTTAPAQPTGLQVKSRTDTSVTLSWTSDDNGVPTDADVYDAATDAKLASVIMKNAATLTGLTAETDYSFYVVVRDFSGNASEASAPIDARTTAAAVVVDDPAAAVDGTWSAGTGGSSTGSGYLYSDNGSGSKTITWTPTLPHDGYYAVYYWLPQRGSGDVWSTNAAFDVLFDGGSKSYGVNEYTAAKGSWVLLGIHRFKAGTAGSVALSDLSDDKVVGDAVKFQYLADFGPSGIKQATLSPEAQQLEVGGTSALNVIGTDDTGLALDLKADGFAIQYISDAPSVASVSSDGVVTGVAAGTAHIQANVTLNGSTLTTNTATVYIGSGLAVFAPVYTNADGAPVTSLQPNGVVNVSTAVANFTAKDQNVTLIVGLYNANGLLLSAVQGAYVKSGGNGTLTATLNLPGDTQGATIRAFVWDGKDRMHPLASGTVFPG
ncbi:golvesin C-terminal-like domain-containing protein [Paenibacillus glycinis]|uniref:Fibronectin type-III domain-containing protein n=1 Tax=Paenibacillus glycinis TaxID=2697035 RepID=A0ABW9XQ81_9BACL|nr:right-handed parallel beta-helix repeat-containing protein [Paenibacillus glycinis]NBD24522.1 hypothetical protein [Paenibacillus glycinis]